MSYLDTILPDVPIFYARLGDRAGTAARDESVNHVDGVYGGTIQLNQAGLVWDGDLAIATLGGQAATSGAAGYMRTPDLASRFTGSSVSLGVWVRPLAPGGVVVTELGTNGTLNTGWHDAQIEVEANGGVKVSVWRGAQANLLIGTLAFGERHFLGLSYDRPNQVLRGFVDGVSGGSLSAYLRQVPNDAHTTDTPPVAVWYALGAADSTNLGNGVNFLGTIDEFAVFNGVLAPARFAAHWAAGNVQPQASVPVAGRSGVIQLRGINNDPL